MKNQEIDEVLNLKFKTFPIQGIWYLGQREQRKANTSAHYVENIFTPNE